MKQMANEWRPGYLALTEFIAEHPEIEIKENSVSIPVKVRPDFYALFDAVTRSFIEEYVFLSLEEARVLGRNYLKAEEQAKQTLGLERVVVPPVSNYPELFKFLRDDPINPLMALLFNPLFGVLPGRKPIEAFAVDGQTIIKRQLSEFYPAGYRLWVTLSFINILEPDINLESSLAETLIHMDHDTWPAEMFVKDHKYEDIFPYLPPGVHQKFPSVAESSRLSLYRWTGLSAAVPSVIVHSAATNQYMGIGSRIGMNKWSKKRDAAMLNRKWYSFGDMSKCRYHR
jgi:hypothetical protein